jgi:hypothetical protein
MTRLAFPILALFAVGPAFTKEPDFSGPAETTKTYLLATRANDLETAKKCWTIEDDNASGALDVIVGMWIESRKPTAAVEAKLGADGVKALGRWNRVNATNAAIDTTVQRLGTVRIQERGDHSSMKIEWQPGDGDTTPAFMCVRGWLHFTRVAGEWKLDANVFTGMAKAADLFGPEKIWPVWRDEMAVMTGLTRMLEKEEIKDLATFEAELKKRVDALKALYEK